MPRLGSELPLHSNKNDDHRPHAVEAYPNNANKRIVILRMVIVFLFIMILRNVFLNDYEKEIITYLPPEQQQQLNEQKKLVDDHSLLRQGMKPTTFMDEYEQLKKDVAILKTELWELQALLLKKGIIKEEEGRQFDDDNEKASNVEISKQAITDPDEA